MGSPCAGGERTATRPRAREEALGSCRRRLRRLFRLGRPLSRARLRLESRLPGARPASETPDLELPTEAVLAAYGADSSKIQGARIYHQYLERIIESWLRDLAYHWKSEHPPYEAEFTQVGLTTKMTRGSTVSESTFAA